MSNSDKNINFNDEFFKKLDIQYSRSKDDIWKELEKSLDEKPEVKIVKHDFRRWLNLSIAAIILLFVGIVSFLRFYTIEINCPNATHKMVELPDGSKVTLNAGSELSYHPYWWKYKRQLQFTGEGFFEVTKGNKFEVVSERATTTVLGTKFNIYSRNDAYRVFCLTGKVKVQTVINEATILEPNDYTIVNKQNQPVKAHNESVTNSISWMNNEFVFTSAELKLILEEVERQYDIEIEGIDNLEGSTTCSFSKSNDPEDLLNNIILKPFGKKCKKINDKKYILESK